MNNAMLRSRYIVSAALALWLSGYGQLPVHSAPASGPTVWNFDKPGNPLAASIGTAKLHYRDPKNTNWGPMETMFETARALGLPMVNGVNAPVMAFPAMEGDQAYTIDHNSPPNGSYAKDGYVSNYTLVMDMFLPYDGKKSFMGLYQTAGDNTGGADMYLANWPGGGLGVDGAYDGSLSPGSWHRVAFAVQCSAGTGQIMKFVDGQFVGGQVAPGIGGSCRWSLGPSFHLFSDGGGDTTTGYLTSLMYTDRVLTIKEMAALGSPSGKGANVPGPASTDQVKASKRVLVVGHRGDSGSGPENTLTAIKQALDNGAQLVAVDVRLTADGVPVLMHDADVRRTTDGSGAVFGKTFAEIRKLDAGSWFDARYAGERVPTLTEALQAARGRGNLFLSVKGPELGRYIMKSLKEAGLGPEAVWVLVNSPEAHADFVRNLPGAPMLWDGIPPGAVSAASYKELKKKGVIGLNVDETLITKDLVDAAHGAGMLVNADPVMAPGRMLALIDMGVDAVETSYPAALTSLMPAKK